MEIKLVKRHRPPYFAIIPLSLFSAALGFYIFETTSVKIAGVMLITFSVIAPFFVLDKSRDIEGIVINDKGIFDRRLGVGMIQWSDITEASLMSRYGNDFLCLKVENLEKFVALMNEKKRKAFRDNEALGFRTFNVAVTKLNIDKIVLLDMVRKKIKETRR